MEHEQLDSAAQALKNNLTGILGIDNVLCKRSEREFYSTDLSWQPGEVAAFVIRPGNLDELSRAVAATTAAGFAVVARGGGMSYTRGYVPERADSVLVDMQRMNRILEINAEDMYVTVECGCTWKSLCDALKEKGRRTPYFGPLSGKYATVGGALSQNSLFLGSGVFNTAAESLLGLKVVLADGTYVTTGSGAHVNSNPFYRHFGPDLTGIFTADTGAFGIKAHATIRLITLPPVTACASFGFETIADMLDAQTKIARLRIAAECYGFDPYYNKSFENLGFTLKEGLAMLGKITKSGSSLMEGIKNTVRVATAGKKLLRNVNYSLHVTMDAIDEYAADSSLRAVRAICLEQGMELDNSLPLAFRADPFGGVRTVLLGAAGELWIPVHGFFPLSRAVAAGEATERFIREKRSILDKYNIRTSYLTCFSGSEFVIEPSFYWHDQLGNFRLSLIEPEFAEKWKDIPANPEARIAVLQLREELRQLFFELGACHLQIGKYYPFKDACNNPNTWQLLENIKSAVDPRGLVNPGSLGLAKTAIAMTATSADANRIAS
jgi:FAD/FMN-containing dehydrogenase